MCNLMAALWLLWTFYGVLAAIPLIPPPPNPDIDWPSPTPETVFRVHILSVVVPEVSVLILMVLDLALHHIRLNKKSKLME